MRRNVIVITGISAALAALWLLTGWASFKTATFFGLRDGFIQLTGVLGFWFLTLCVLLAARPVWLESAMGGLDKMYRVHKWAGILAMAIVVIHWFLAAGFKILMQFGIMASSGGRPAGHGGPGTAEQTLLQRLTGPAHWTSQWAFYLMIVLGLIALLTFIGYRVFALSHRLESVIYLALVFHSAVLFTRAYWLSPIGVLTAIMMAIGAVYATLIFFRVANNARRVRGTVVTVERHPELSTLKIGIKLEKKWIGHRAGQFAFLKTRFLDEPHPFSIASEWNDGRILYFFVKELGDYTKRLPSSIKEGDVVRVEGPYGRFNFVDGKKSQIWIGGGIGITPFIGRLRELAAKSDRTAKITLYYSVSRSDGGLEDEIRSDAAKAGVQLKIWDSARLGRLTGEKIMEENPDWKEGSVWFCGPAGFMKTLRRSLINAGMNSGDFHRELFNIR